MSANKNAYTVLGAGSWGTALAMLLSQNGHQTMLWGRDSKLIDSMSSAGVNQKYLGNELRLPAALRLSHDLDVALKHADVVLLAVPCHHFRGMLEAVAEPLKRCKKLVWACKGLEVASGALLHTVAEEVLGLTVQKAVISGPNFAKEVAMQMPSATTVAGDSMAFANEIALDLHSNWFRAYSSDDMLGVQIAGALKNGLAIATGIADGLGFGANTRAALITRGLQEITRLGLAIGGKARTFSGLAGIGDLLMTCTDNQSRNRRLGLLLAAGQPLDEAIKEIGQAVEGVELVRAANHLAGRQRIELPILEQVHQVLYENKAPRLAVEDLLARDQRAEL